MTTTKNLSTPVSASLNWDVPLNSNFTAIEKAFGFSTNITAITGTYSLTSSDLGNMALRCTGSQTGDLTIQVPATNAGQWVVTNATTDATGGPWRVFVTSASGGTPIEIDRGTTRSVYADGTANGVVFADTPFSTGATTEVVYNNAGDLVGSPNLTFDGSNLRVGGQTRSATYKDASGGDAATINGITPVDTASVLNTFNVTGSAPVFACRAWANIQGTGTVTLRAGGNISSVSREVGVPGSYYFFFSTPMPDTNYSVTFSATPEVSGQHTVGFIGVMTTTYCRIDFYSAANSSNRVDKSIVCMSIFR